MTVRTAERRRSARSPAAYPAVVYNRRGRILARGRTANISENGVSLVVRPHGSPLPKEILLGLRLPAIPTARSRRPASRTVSYRARIVWTRAIAQLLGLGIEFLEKVT